MEKERYLNQLLEVIQVLRGAESDVARKHLKAYESNHTVNLRKMFQLYKCIKINEIRDYEKLKKRISPDSTDDSFNKLIRRTTERLQESLIIDVNIRRKDAYNDIFRLKFLLLKKNMQCQILIARGLVKQPLNMVNNSIRKAKKYELYSEIIELIRTKQTILSRLKGITDYRELSTELEFYENCRSLFNESRKFFEELNLTGLSILNKKSESEKYLNNISKIYSNYELTSSKNILSYYYLLQIEVCKIGNDHYGLIKNTKCLISEVTNSPVLYSVNRLSYLYNELAKSNLNVLDFQSTQDSLIESSNYISLKSVFYLNNQLLSVRLNNLKLDFFTSEKLATNILNEGLTKSQPYYNSMFTIHTAVAYFGLKQYKEAQSILLQKNEIEKDKEVWNVWIRIMRLLCSIEMLKLNLIDYDIESFRKYLERTSKQYEVRERDRLVLKVLQELDKNDYNFSLTAIVVADELEKLKSTNKKYAWNPDSPELILFHDWFESKLLKKEYEPNFEVYRAAMKKEE